MGVAKRSGVKKKAARPAAGGRRSIGPRGRTGPRGPAGPPGIDSTSHLAQLTAQVELLVRELQTQLIRIGQLQAQLDQVAGSQASEPQTRRSGDRGDR